MDPRTYTATATLAKIKAAIDTAGLTREEVAARSGIAKTTLLRKLAGFVSFTLDDVASLAAVLNVEPDSLVEFRLAA